MAQLEESQETPDHSQMSSKVRVSRLSHFSCSITVNRAVSLDWPNGLCG